MKRISDLPGLHCQAIRLKALQDRVEQQYEALVEQANTDQALCKFQLHKTTEQHNNCESRFSGSEPETPAVSPASGDNNLSDASRQDGYVRLLHLIRKACPAIQHVALDTLSSWQALQNSADFLCLAAGIDKRIWQDMRMTYGTEGATIALVITVQKLSIGLVFKPRAYLQALVRNPGKHLCHLTGTLRFLVQCQQNTGPTSLSGLRKSGGPV